MKRKTVDVRWFFAFVIFIMLEIVTVFHLTKYIRWNGYKEITSGIVTDRDEWISPEGNGIETYLYEADYTYQVDGKEYHAITSRFSRDYPMRADEKLTVWYDGERPECSITDDERKENMSSLVYLSIWSAAALSLTVVLVIRKKRE